MAYHLIGQVPAAKLDATFDLGNGALPSGTAVALISGLDGLAGDGFVVADVGAIIVLTGNTHDPHYRYVRVPPHLLFADTDEEASELERIEANWARAYPGANEGRK